MGFLTPKLPNCPGKQAPPTAEPGNLTKLGSHLSLAHSCFVLKVLSLWDHSQRFFLSLSRECANQESTSLLVVNSIWLAASESDFAKAVLNSELSA